MKKTALTCSAFLSSSSGFASAASWSLPAFVVASCSASCSALSSVSCSVASSSALVYSLPSVICSPSSVASASSSLLPLSSVICSPVAALLAAVAAVASCWIVAFHSGIQILIAVAAEYKDMAQIDITG